MAIASPLPHPPLQDGHVISRFQNNRCGDSAEEQLTISQGTQTMDPFVAPFSFIAATAGQFAAVAIMLAGLAMILGLRQWCGKLLLLAMLFVVVSVMGPAWVPTP